MCFYSIVYWEKLQYPFLRQSGAGMLADIHDGSVIKNLMKPGHFLSKPEHAALILNTDGVQAFNSSKHSIWPVYLTVANLPPEMRMKERNIILASVWFGPHKPNDMSIILEPVVSSVKELSSTGITASTPAGKKLIKAMIIAAVFDLPAKAAVLNTIQFNGYCGCIYCKDKGENVSAHQHVYLPMASHELRTEKEMIQWANEAKARGKPVYGVKGLSILSKIVNIPFGVPIDYMHAVLEGVVKSLMNCWFKDTNQPYSLQQYTTSINQAMLRIKPPHEFRRSPRSIESFAFWKASEYRVFLLFYAIPLLKDYLPCQYIYHLSLLVHAMHRLLSTAILISELDEVQIELTLFYNLVPQLYDFSLRTANVHSLCHLVTLVRYWGVCQHLALKASMVS